VLAKTPIWIIGKPYSDTDPYAVEFLKLAKENPNFIRYEGAIQDRRELAKAYRQARGFVLLSTRETLSLSSFEAAACECPLLLSDLPWARTTFKEQARYCPVTSVTRTAEVLRQFYDDAPNLKPPPKPLSWIGIAQEMKTVYERVLSTSR
jgi:glycosyltransferase involved in cell wall biosynthesis